MNDIMSEELQSKLQQEVDKYKAIQKEYHKSLTQRHQLDSQLNENTSVKQELDLLKKGAEVYKMIGPVLIKQDQEEAKQNVAKRMDYIRAELKRVDETIETLDKQQDIARETLGKMQQVFQQAQMQGATKA